MNIFYLDHDPVKAAQAQCDKHVIKMVLETAQLLCTTHRYCGTKNLPSKFYKATHQTGPNARWIREGSANYNWLCKHGLALCKEYTLRYGKLHASQQVIEWCMENIPNIPDSTLISPPAQVMPEVFHNACPVTAYRNMYNYHKRTEIKMTWKTQPPSWWL